MSPEFKKELLSIGHTFLSVFIPIFLLNLQVLDITNLSKEVLIGFGVAVFRAVIKAFLNKYFPATI